MLSMTTDFDDYVSPFTGAESMPLDFSVLLSRSPPNRLGYERLHDWVQGSQFGCRRVSSYPTVKGHQPLISGLKVRSQSESEALHRAPVVASLADLKRELSSVKAQPVHEDDEEDDSDGSSGVSSVGVPSPPASPKQQHIERPKKRVMFADDCGMELTTVRVMTEPSDVPPRLSPSVLRSLLGEAAGDEEAKPTASWIVHFTQPASEYVKFRETLEQQKVALENVLARNDQCKMIGTIKVKNIGFEKQVFIRFTDNNWQSYFDRPAVYQRSAATANMYDTFCFDIEIPCDDDAHNKIEFCVCFRTNDGEYWDSNGGKNYALVSPSLHQLLEQTSTQRQHGQLFGTSHTPTNVKDAYVLDYDNWTKFASWKTLSTDTPYW